MKYSPCLIALVFSLAWNTPLSAQTLDSTKADTVPKVRENWYWVSGELGAGSVTRAGAALVVAFGGSVAFKSTVVSADIRSIIGDWSSGRGVLASIGGLYGWTYRQDWWFASTSVGTAYIMPGVSGGGTVGIIPKRKLLSKPMFRE